MSRSHKPESLAGGRHLKVVTSDWEKLQITISLNNSVLIGADWWAMLRLSLAVAESCHSGYSDIGGVRESRDDISPFPSTLDIRARGGGSLR
jgi:hypothetical protein